MNTQTLPEPTFDASELADKKGSTEQHQATPPLFDWVAPTHHDHDRTRRWYVIAGSIAALVALIALFWGAWSVSIVTVVLTGLYALSRHEETPKRRMRIEGDGFSYGDVFVPWTDCIDFWIVQTPAFSELHIQRKRGSPREVIIQTGDINLTVLRSSLSQFIPVRADQRERLLDALIRVCKL